MKGKESFIPGSFSGCTKPTLALVKDSEIFSANSPWVENDDSLIFSLPLLNLANCSRQMVLDYFENTWKLTETLFSSLNQGSAFYAIPYHQLRHPLIFYYGHTAVFYVNKCILAGLMDEKLNPYFEDIFSTGVDEMSWDDMSKNQRPWPELWEVVAYRKTVYEKIKKIIETHPGFEQLPITDESPLWALFMGFEHERIHLETSSVLIRELPNDLVEKPKNWPEYYPLVNVAVKNPKRDIDYPSNAFIDVSAGFAEMGKPKDFPSYGWDNEYGTQKVWVEPFRASQFLVSNGDFFEFVNNEGYQNRKYWSEEGWQWRSFRNTILPAFWSIDTQEEYKLRLCFEIVPMQWSWPVDVNFHEAQAYCAWLSDNKKPETHYFLINETEHHRLRDEMLDDPIMIYSGAEMKAKKININLAYGAQTPVNKNAKSSLGFYDLFGNSWEWSNSTFAPLNGFKEHDLYPDFSAPCFDGKHNMILGGSFISTGDEASQWARFHFRRHFFQHVGFRLIQRL